MAELHLKVKIAKNCSAYTHNSCVFHEMMHNNILFNKSKEIAKEYDGICTSK